MADAPFPEFPVLGGDRHWTVDGRWGIAYEERHGGWRLYNADGAGSERWLPTEAVRQVIARTGIGDELMRAWDDWHDFGASGS